MRSYPLTATAKRLFLAVIFSIAFGYIEAAVVVYLRVIFYPDGFAFPLVDFGTGELWRRMLMTEIGREAATLVLILTASRLFSRGRRQAAGYFLIIFAVWDIFYYVWLKVLIDWPASIMDWDILFLIPVPWASPVLAPVIVSLIMFAFGVIVLCRGPVGVKKGDLSGFVVCSLVVVISFCIGGLRITDADFSRYFYWPLFLAGNTGAIAIFAKCLRTSGRPKTDS